MPDLACLASPCPCLKGLASTLQLTAVTKPVTNARTLQYGPMHVRASAAWKLRDALMQILLSRNSEHYSDSSTTSTVGRLPGTGAWQWTSPNPPSISSCVREVPGRTLGTCKRLLQIPGTFSECAGSPSMHPCSHGCILAGLQHAHSRL